MAKNELLTLDTVLLHGCNLFEGEPQSIYHEGHLRRIDSSYLAELDGSYEENEEDEKATRAVSITSEVKAGRN